NKADPNQTESEHNLTPIHVLCDAPYKGQTLTDRADLIHLMVKKGADVNHLDKHNMASIHKAVIHNHVDCTQALLEEKANPNIALEGDTALVIAARNGQSKILKLLLNNKETKIDVRNEHGGTVLHFAAAGMIDSPECVELLLGQGINVNIQD
ncbi:unnamed protein product, partial [Didymodactylos carnosus]